MVHPTDVVFSAINYNVWPNGPRGAISAYWIIFRYQPVLGDSHRCHKMDEDWYKHYEYYIEGIGGGLRMGWP